VSAPQRVLVTGAAGFIGSHVTRVLLEAGRDVVIVVRPGNSPWRLRDVVDRLNVIGCDLSEPEMLRPALESWRPEACIHLAWYAEPGKYLTANENVPSLTSSLRLLDELIRVDCGQIVMAGTCAEYDTDQGYLREDSPTRPTTLYAATKLSLNLMASQIAASAGVNLAWARLFFLYGPYEDERRLVPALIRALLRGEPFPATAGEQVRDYMHVSDMASALCALAERRVSGSVNVCSGVPVTIRQVMETVADVAGNGDLIQYGTVPYRHWDPRFICGDNRRLREDACWIPRYPTLRTGLEQTVAWWRARDAP
jgi:nucleoside-diphosphate-sugar epimerase